MGLYRDLFKSETHLYPFYSGYHRVLTSPLFDGRQIARDLEAAYTRMYERYQAGLPPESFAVE